MRVDDVGELLQFQSGLFEEGLVGSLVHWDWYLGVGGLLDLPVVVRDAVVVPTDDVGELLGFC